MFLKQPPAILKSRSGKCRTKPIIVSPEFDEESVEGASEPLDNQGAKPKKKYYKRDEYGVISTTTTTPNLFPDYYYLDYFADYKTKISKKKLETTLNERQVCERLTRCKMADVESLTCLVEHCQRAFKECFTLAFHLSYSHIDYNGSSSNATSVCLLCGKQCTNGRSLSLHSHLTHRDVSTRHSAEMRALSRLVDCQAAANRERMLNLHEKSKKFELPEVDFPETIRFPYYRPQPTSKVTPTTSASSKTRVVNLPLKRCVQQSQLVNVSSTGSSDFNGDHCGRSSQSPSELYSHEEIDESQREGHNEPEESLSDESYLGTNMALPVHVVVVHDERRRSKLPDDDQQQQGHISFNFCNKRTIVKTTYTNCNDDNDEDDDGQTHSEQSSSGFRQSLTKALQRARASRNKMHQAQTTLHTSTETESDLQQLNGCSASTTRKRTLYDMHHSFDGVEYLTNCASKLTKRPWDERLSLVPEDVTSPNDGLSMQWPQDIDLN